MTVISGRYLVVLLAALLVALVPTVRHGYLSSRADAAPIVAASVPGTLEGAAGSPRVRAAAWVAETYGAGSWIERTYEVTGAGQVRLFVARGYDLKKLYHHPELGVLHGVSVVNAGIAALGGDAARPVHVLRSDKGDGTGVLYALVYRDAWVADPYRLQISSAFSALWSARHPLTLILVSGAVVDPDGQPTALGVRALSAAWRAIEATDGRGGVAAGTATP